MKEIKFRAWWSHPEYNPKGKMYFVGGLYFAKKQDSEPEYDFCGIDEVGLMERKQNCKIGWNTAKECILMQYTGLKDKNGVEIYGGDIVEWKYLKTWHKNEVRWVGGGFVVTTSGFKDDLNEPQDLSLVSILNCEIIGNIYENPELLSK